MTLKGADGAHDEHLSSDQRLSRADFVKRVVKGSVSSGTLLVAASVVVDSFLVPPGVAAASSCTIGTLTTHGGPDTVGGTGGNTDTSVSCTYGSASGLDTTGCSGNADSTLGSCFVSPP